MKSQSLWLFVQLWTSGIVRNCLATFNSHLDAEAFFKENVKQNKLDPNYFYAVLHVWKILPLEDTR